MAKQTVNIGSTANDGTGDQLRNAFNKLNQNNDEIYGNNFVTELMLNDDIVGAAELKVTGNGNAGQLLQSDGDGTMTWVTGVTGDITGVTAGDGLTGGGDAGAVTLTVVGGAGITASANEIALTDGGVGTTQLADDAVTADKLANAVNTLISTNTAKTGITSSQASAITTNSAKTGITSGQASAITANTNKTSNATHTGDVTGSGELTIAANAVTTAKINNDAVTHDKLSARFTAEVAISDRTGTATYNCALGSSFKLSGDLLSAYTISLTNYKKGQVITIYPLKAQTVTLAAGSGTGVFYKLSEVNYDNSVSSILQIECVDDQAANPVFFYSVATFAADATI